MEALREAGASGASRESGHPDIYKKMAGALEWGPETLKYSTEGAGTLEGWPDEQSLW